VADDSTVPARTSWESSWDKRYLRADPGKQRKYELLAQGPFFAPVVDLASAYVAAAIADPIRTAGEFWALSCLPGTTPRRLSALTMRITDILVIYRTQPPQVARAVRAVQAVQVEALMIVERSTLEAAFGSRAHVRKRYPQLRFVDSDYHGAGTDQLMITGPWTQMVRSLRDERVADAARQMANRMMAAGRVMHWRGHNSLLADHVLGLQ
jgi:hypothetical protein